MQKIRLRLAAEIAGLGALGVQTVEDLLDREGRVSPRAEALGRQGARTDLRFPLPGTPTADGLPRGRPAGSGTGWVRLQRWNMPSLGPLLRSRFTAPRSASLAERHWNLFCHLQNQGIGTPRPLAVGARGQGLVARDSFLVTAELEDFEPLDAWLASEERPRERARALAVLASVLAKLAEARVYLPELALGDLRIAPAEAGCGEAGDFGGGVCSEPSRLRKNELPGIALARVEGGVLRRRLSAAELEEMLVGVLHDRLPGGAVAFSPAEIHGLAEAALDGVDGAADRLVRIEDRLARIESAAR